MLQRVARDIRNTYTLGYMPPTPGWRRLRRLQDKITSSVAVDVDYGGQMGGRTRRRIRVNRDFQAMLGAQDAGVIPDESRADPVRRRVLFSCISSETWQYQHQSKPMWNDVAVERSPMWSEAALRFEAARAGRADRPA